MKQVLTHWGSQESAGTTVRTFRPKRGEKVTEETETGGSAERERIEVPHFKGLHHFRSYNEGEMKKKPERGGKRQVSSKPSIY